MNRQPKRLVKQLWKNVFIAAHRLGPDDWSGICRSSPGYVAMPTRLCLGGLPGAEAIKFARRSGIWLPNQNKTETLLVFRRRITTFGGDVRLFGRHAFL